MRNCSMNEQYLKGIQKREKFYLILVDSNMLIATLALLLNVRKRDISILGKEQTKESENEFLGLSCDSPRDT